MKLAFDIADAVVSELNGAPAGTFTEAFTAVRRAIPLYNIAELKNLTVTVVPKKVEINAASRATSSYEFAIDVGIQKKIGKDTDAEVTALSVIVGEIVDYLMNKRKLTAASWAQFTKIANEPVYSPEHLAEDRVFFSIVTVSYSAVAA